MKQEKLRQIKEIVDDRLNTFGYKNSEGKMYKKVPGGWEEME